MCAIYDNLGVIQYRIFAYRTMLYTHPIPNFAEALNFAHLRKEPNSNMLTKIVQINTQISALLPKTERYRCNELLKNANLQS